MPPLEPLIDKLVCLGSRKSVPNTPTGVVLFILLEIIEQYQAVLFHLASAL